MKKVYHITEYSSFIPERTIPGYVTLPEHTFNQLEQFLLLHRSDRADGLELLGLSARRGTGKIITAKQYVGVIAMKDGTRIEILPKIYDGSDTETQMKHARALLLDMLRTLPSLPFKTLHAAGLKTERLSILEVFIAMFVEEVFLIVKRGMRCSYEAVEENTTFFRGKMKFSRNTAMNHAHRERCFMEHDEFTANRPENRILKTTLQHLYACCTSWKNKNNIRTLLAYFAETRASADPEADFARSSSGRDMKDYAAALSWSRIFLAGRSFTPFSGPDVALALLFPMDTLFERYVATRLAAYLPHENYAVSLQESVHCLFHEPRALFRLRPDIVIRRMSDKAVFVLDTKWKRLNRSCCDIARSDMYQMFVYQKKYDAKKVLLLYPATDQSPPAPERLSSEDGVHVEVLFLDMLNMQRSLAQIAQALAC